MQIEVTLLQYHVVKVIKRKPATRESICKQLDNFNHYQVGQALRFLTEQNKIELKENHYHVIHNANYFIAPRLQRLIGEEETLVPPIRVYQPDELTKLDVLKLHKQGYTRTEIAKRLKLTKMMVLWTLCNNVEERRQAPDADALYVDDIQARVYRVMLRQITQLETIADRAKISRQECEIILRELIDLGAVVIQRTKYGLAYFQVECNLIPNRKRSKVANAN